MSKSNNKIVIVLKRNPVISGFLIMFVLCFIFVVLDRSKHNSENIDNSQIGLSILKSELKDPNSFRLERLTYFNDTEIGEIGCVTYSARNSFNGYVDGLAIITVNKNKFALTTPSNNQGTPFQEKFKYLCQNSEFKYLDKTNKYK